MKQQQHHVSSVLSSLGAPAWLVPSVIGIGLFVHKHFISCDASQPGASLVDARARAARRKVPVRKRSTQQPPKSKASPHLDMPAEQQVDQEQQLADAVGLGQREGAYEFYTEDEVELLHQAQANPQALFDLLKQYGTQLAAEQHHGDDSEGSSMWYTDDPEDDWHQGSPSSSVQLKDNGSTGPQQQQGEQQQATGQDFLRRLAAAVQQQQQQQQQGANSDNDDADAGAAYFDDSYFGMTPDASGAPQDLQELQALVSKNLEALLPKDTTTWGQAGSSYPPRFDEVLSPSAAGAGAGAGGGHIDPPNPGFGDLDDDLDPGFDYVPDFDFEYDADFGPLDDFDHLELEDDLFDIEP